MVYLNIETCLLANLTMMLFFTSFCRSSVKRLMAWMNEQANPRNTAIVLTIINVVYLGIFIRECLRSDEHAKDCTADDNGDRNSSYRIVKYGCHDPYACPWYRALVAQYAVMLVLVLFTM